ncbi:MAG: bifunctional homocysteine S-methyltransferase/methylenetetrahydrofolate reductase [Polyangiaceae bacterium]
MVASRPEIPFLEKLKQSIVVFDGAMGSLLYERGIFVTQNFEQLNVARPDVVKRIHADYLAAGAQVLLTNTFGANKFRLDRHGLGSEVRSYNLAGARNAREIAGHEAYVAGSIGPTGLVPGVMTKEELAAAEQTFAEQAEALVEGGVDLLVIETFRHTEEIEIAIRAARKAAPGIPLLASMTFDATETVADGSPPEKVAEILRSFGVDMLGVNCGDGPQLSLAMAERMRGAGLPLCVQPNAGLPRNVDGRLLYMATPEYFDVFARRMIQLGASMIGGCCGTTPDHIRWMANSVRMLSGLASVEHTKVVVEPPPAAVQAMDPVPLAQRSKFAEKIASGKFVVSVEVNPAPGLDPTSALNAAKMLLDNGIDIVNVADGPRATARMSNLAFCALLLERYGIEPLMHVCGRDRNIIGQMAHLLGANAIGIKNLVVITGDPPKVGDYPEASAVYDLDSIGILQMASNLNRGIDPAGKRLTGGQTSFVCATGVEPGAADLEKELRRLELKRKAGADFVMTQPVFQQELLDSVLERARALGMPVMVGVLPLVSYKNAEFLHNEVPGMQIPEHIRERMRRVPGGVEARKEGVKIAREMLFSVRDRVQGAYLMPPLGRYELALEVLDGLKG